ncbi:hypothetical protein A9Q99_04500 [Gammaproteobacteria bacterium 45_16_T64]|nr:hypothetical protein A9Q99_04500 [Gammaproteobacteria bacterium 45_16_T64]
MKLGASEYYTRKQLNGLNKLGDIVVPRNGSYPSFSDTGCCEYIDEVMTPADTGDIAAFGYLLLGFNYAPTSLITLILWLANNAERMPGLIAPPFRMLNISLRGVIYSLYYSNKTHSSYTGPLVHDVIDYNVICKPDQQG